MGYERSRRRCQTKKGDELIKHYKYFVDFFESLVAYHKFYKG
ncbi:type III-A CRISPR-associated protein Csm2 [Fervidobacterium gondwanense]